MAGLTSEGLVIKTLPEIRTALENKLKARYGSSFSVDTNTPEGVMIGVFADELSDAWEGIQGTYDAAYPKSATDLNLDNVSDIVDVRRIQASKSSATLEFTGLVGAVIPEDTVVTVTDTEERFLVTTPLTLTATRFSDITFGISSVVDSTVYTLTINNIVVSINSGVSATAATIMTALKAAIDATVAGVTTSLPTASTLRVNVTEVNSIYALVVGSRISVNSVSDLVESEALNSGVIKAPAGTLVNLLVPIINVTSVTNLADADEGREEETDEELRVRRYESVAIIGAATLNAITANVRNLDDVTAAFIIENKEYSVDVDGRPPKSFEVVVEGGDESEIAQTIWDYHPVGIESVGDITRTVTDLDDNIQSVSFSRPVDVYIKVEVDYTKYTEEPFPTTAEDAIKTTVLTYGNTLNIGNDVIPKRFFGSIYNAVDGIEDIVIRISKSYDEITWTSFTESPIAIARKESSVFDISRIVVAEV